MKTDVYVKGVSTDRMTAAQLYTTVTHREDASDDIINDRAISKFHTFMRKTDPDVLNILTTFTVTKV